MIRRIPALKLLLLLAGLSLASTAYAQNPIQLENAKAGASDWRLTNPALSHEIEGYASLTSVPRGGQISFFVNTSSATYTLDIFRMGWYGGLGARRMGATLTFAGTAQAACPMDSPTGMVECRWINPAVLSVPNDAADPTNWASGIYLVKLTALPGGKQSYITFTVRDDARVSQFLFTQQVTTYQAYNYWGGKSLYDFNSTGGPAVKVSFNRPYANEADPGADVGIGSGEFLHAWEYNAIRWLERNGYDVTYATSVDLHEQAGLLLSHRAYLSFGHNEYWSANMRTNVMNAADAGINMGFFGANPLYWQIRFETSPVTGQADRTQVCYKTTADPVKGVTQTVRWRDLGMPEAAFVGVMYRYDPVNADIVVQNTTNWVFQGTGLHDGDHLVGLLGYEVDSTDVSTPTNAVVLGSSPYSGGTQPSNMTVYTTPSGATVFASGSMQIAWGLDDYNAPTYRTVRSSAAVDQMFKNILARFTAIIVTVSPGTATLTAGQTQQLTATVTGTTTTSVTWSVSPAVGTVSPTGLYTAPSAIAAQQLVTVTATSDADTTKTASAAITLLPPGAINPIRVHAGGAAYTDTLGQLWSADAGFTGGTPDSTTAAIANTTDQALYKTERWGTFSYSFTVPNGSYAVTLKFAEIYFTAANRRLFNVAINGASVLSAFDIYTQAGGANRAYDRTFTVNVTTGAVLIQFTPGAADDPKISAIQIVSAGPPPPPPPVVTVSPTTASLTAGLTQQFTATVTGAANTAVTWSMSPSVGTLSTTGLYTAPASIAAQQLVTVTATSVADTTAKASATVTLVPPAGPVTVSVSPTTASLTAGQTQQFTATVTNNANTAVTWSVSPAVGTLSAAGLYSAPGSIASQQTVMVTATSVADTTKFATATVTLNPPPAFTPIRVNAGGAAYTDSLGQVWAADTGFSGGAAASTTSAITNTNDQTLYRSERWGAFTYTFTVPAGNYSVTLKFAEIYFTAANQRRFNVAINGTPVLANFDVFTQAGGALRAFDQTFAVSSTGTITIQFSPGTADDPKISAIEITAPSGPQVAAPLFAPAGGNYTSAQSVTITDATPGAQIYYTLDNSTPSASSTPYGGSIAVSTATTIKAIAVLGAVSSPVAAATYTFQAATPTFSPAGGTYSVNQNVTISSPGAQIYYTTDNSTPTTASTPYTAPVAVTRTTTLRAIAVLGGGPPSAVASATYTMRVATPTFSPAAGTYSVNQTVSINDASAGAAIYYTTNGSTPTTSSTLYAGPISVTATTTIRAIAVIAGWTNSAVGTAAYTMRVATPTFSPVAGTYAVGQQVTITDASPGARIYYTTNGTTPTTSSTLYSGPITLNASATVRAIAVITGWTNSAVGSAAYTIQ